jgi:endonuclease/exonuclease/phosphatase family metal-dependent hydrolase
MTVQDPLPRVARVLTWNIHGAIGADRRHNLERVIALVRRHGPDIVALQEVDSRGRDPLNLPLAAFKAVLGSHAAEARTIVAEDGHYGHVLISRWPIESVQLHDISVGRREPRCAIEATMATACGRFRVVATHLGLGVGERRRQVARLLGLARTSASMGPASDEAQPDGLVMLGDFNDWHGYIRRALMGDLPAWSVLKTFPARRPFLKLDRIFCRPAGALIQCWTDPEARRASDHLPVVADLKLAALAGISDRPSTAPVPDSDGLAPGFA